MLRRAGLGSVDGALLLDRKEFSAYPPDKLSSVVTLIPLELIDANAHNPREDLRDLEALAASIRQFALLQPVLVRPVGDRYQLLAGHRRRAAFQLLRDQEPLAEQWQRIPAIVRQEADDQQAHMILLASQAHSNAWSPRELAAAIEELLRSGLTMTRIGEAFGRSEAWVSKRARVLTDDVLGGYVMSGALPASTAEEFLRLRDPAQRAAVAARAAAEGWSQAQAKAEMRQLQQQGIVSDDALARQIEHCDDVVFRAFGQAVGPRSREAAVRLRRHLDELLAEQPQEQLAA